jgi:hypothetical protein
VIVVSATIVELDKTYTGGVATYGNIQIRVVVVKPKPKKGEKLGQLEVVVDSDGQEPIDEGTSPLSAYLERAAHGKQCIVFVVNGQRHDALDNSFIVRELGFKYLRTRTMIIVDLDGLTLEAISEIVQGGRQGLYQGEVMAAIQNRMVATLKTDPDLTRLQTEAEQQIAELQAGDEVVREKLDELIEAHHSAAQHVDAGTAQGQPKPGDASGSYGKDRQQDVIIQAQPDIGEQGEPPVLGMAPDVSKIRLRSGVERVVMVGAVPETAWNQLENVQVRVQPTIEELTIAEKRMAAGLELRLMFRAPDGFDEDEYPLVSTLQAIAKFRHNDEPRLLEREIVISRAPGPPPPPPPPLVLRANPTFFRVVTRQPVKLVPGGPSTHVRMRWDGDDSLTAGATPSWALRARCLTLGTFPVIGFTQSKGGKFELLLDTPHGVIPNQQLDFEVEAVGPAGQRLLATFVGQVLEAPTEPEPRRRAATVPEPAAQRRPPYELKKVKEADWETPTCWGEEPWTKDDVAAFTEPTDTTPLTLIINEDAEELKAFRDDLLKRALDESTVKERITRYTAHVAFHLYQMYRFRKAQVDAQATDDSVHVPSDDDLHLEIGRVATTLLKLMEVSR